MLRKVAHPWAALRLVPILLVFCTHTLPTNKNTGVATTTIRNYGKSGSASIDIVKGGEGSITIPAAHDTLQRYGDYSAAQVADGAMWFAVPCTKLTGGHDPLVDASYSSWISNKHLE